MRSMPTTPIDPPHTYMSIIESISTTRDEFDRPSRNVKTESRSSSKGIANFVPRSFRCSNTPKPVNFLFASKKVKSVHEALSKYFFSQPHLCAYCKREYRGKIFCLFSHDPLFESRCLFKSLARDLRLFDASKGLRSRDNTDLPAACYCCDLVFWSRLCRNKGLHGGACTRSCTVGKR